MYIFIFWEKCDGARAFVLQTMQNDPYRVIRSFQPLPRKIHVLHLNLNSVLLAANENFYFTLIATVWYHRISALIYHLSLIHI